MELIRAASSAASLALLSSPHHAYAQVDTFNQNLTVRFFYDGQQDSCDYTNSSNALTFTTESIPVTYHCFDFADLFGGNATQGFVNQTSFQSSGLVKDGNAGIHWQLENKGSYNPQANYSKVLYRQHISSPASDDQKPGRFADRMVTIYGAPGCREADPNSNTTLFPWYGFSCWSDDSGSCGTLPYKIASFNIYPGEDETSRQNLGKCWVFAKYGAATGVYSSFRVMIRVFVSAGLAVWLTL